MARVREYTNRILESIEEGSLDRDTVILACLNYMSEASVKDMAESEGFFPDDEEEEEESEPDWNRQWYDTSAELE